MTHMFWHVSYFAWLLITSANFLLNHCHRSVVKAAIAAARSLRAAVAAARSVQAAIAAARSVRTVIAAARSVQTAIARLLLLEMSGWPSHGHK